jgi:hypothetical protein
MQKIEYYDSQGNLIETVDTRTLEFAKSDRIQTLKWECTQYILENYPDFKQRNAAMAIYAPEENLRIINGVKSAIDAMNLIETTINNCQTKDQVDAIFWDISIL